MDSWEIGQRNEPACPPWKDCNGNINNKEASWLHAELFFVLVSMWLPQQHMVSIWTPHGIHVETMLCPVETT